MSEQNIEEKKGVFSALRKLFSGSKSSDKSEYGAGYITGGAGTLVSINATNFKFNQQDKDGTSQGGFTTCGADMSDDLKLPEDRFAKYPFLEEMAKFPTLSDALDIHLTHALSTDKKTNQSFTIAGKQGKNDKETKTNQAIAESLMNELGEVLNREMPGWAKVMCIYGVNYVRPYGTQGIGVTSFEGSYYTLPCWVREYVRGSELAGFTNEWFWRGAEKNNLLAEPWALVPLKIPYWVPSRTQIPVTTGLQGYALMDDPMARLPIETQNYGTSLLENSFGPYQNLVNALKSLKASRNNASKIDRLIGVNTSSLDPVNAAALINTITAAFKKNADMMKKQAIRGGYTPTVVNNVIPVMGEGGKGSMTVDTQTTTADIGQIEDIMFYLRQLAASVGLDVTLLGWADMMSGGLGEGGFFRTSVQAAMRAQWIRNAVSTFIYRVIDIHLAFKTGKVYLPADRPYVVQFNSLNTAIQEEEQAEQESRANYASIIATVLDAVQNSPALAGSPTFMRLLCGDMFKFGDAVTDALIKELKGEVGSGMVPPPDDQLLESIRRLPPEERFQLIEDCIKHAEDAYDA
ncbi:portal protein [Escherichia coli]|uniref:portal protein n=1 Tax=Escherichia coli TaxID=562 RepID=UPI000A187FD3|nr:portal protein [Escherichia coli]OSK33741.1 hypothetical protein EAHG_04980 [Escherichia coli B671]